MNDKPFSVKKLIFLVCKMCKFLLFFLRPCPKIKNILKYSIFLKNSSNALKTNKRKKIINKIIKLFLRQVQICFIFFRENIHITDMFLHVCLIT